MYENLHKYPRTAHLPGSASVISDDVYHLDLSHFVSKEIVVIEKMDGENASLYRDNISRRFIR